MRKRLLTRRAFTLVAPVLLFLSCASVADAQWGSYPHRPLRLQDLVPPDGRRFLLEQTFDYKDPRGRVWTAPTGLLYDGASIPQPFWSVIGGPYEGLYREGAAVHDAGCCAQTAKWQDVHHMFYEAMRCSGVGFIKAKIMFYAVWAGGPRWKTLNTAMPATCRRSLYVDPNVQKNIITRIKSRSLSPLEAEAVARPFVTDHALTANDVAKVVAELKARELTADEQAIIAQSVVETIYFPPEEVRSVADWVEKNDPSLEQIEQRAEHARATADLQRLSKGSNASFINPPAFSASGATGTPAAAKNTFFPDVPDLAAQQLPHE